jgi:glycosyltransferase involved in cell wall biosynthesis
MKIVMITSNDPAGVGINFSRALNKFTEHESRLVTTEIRYNFMYEKDIHVPFLQEFSELERLLAEADIFHFHMSADESMMLGPLCVKDFVGGKKLVHHHHGEPPFRANPRYFADKEMALGRKAIVATPDLLKMYPEATWIPNPVPLDSDLYRPGERGGRIVASHSPTRKELKNTDTFVKVTAMLRDSFDNFVPVVIENTPHKECLRIKRSSNVFFDHMQGYYGVSSLEALSQGVATIAGLDDWNRFCLQQFTGSDRLPWIIARNEDELKARLVELLSDDAFCGHVGLESRSWMETFWSEEKIASRLAEFYRSL